MTHGVKSIDIQAFWFRADLWTRGAAKEWLDDHNLNSGVYRTRQSDDGELTHHIFPQFPPDDPRIVEGTWRTIADDFPPGVSATTCERKEKHVMKMIQKTGTQAADNPFEYVMSDMSVDRVGDIIDSKGWDLEQFKKNPIALYGHNHDKVIGTWENVRIVGKRLVGKLKLAAANTSAEIDTIRKLVEQRILRAVSVGFQPLEAEPIKETGGYKFTKQILHECSLVAVPANANALAIAKSAGADRALLAKLFPNVDAEGHISAPSDSVNSGSTQTGGRLANLHKIERSLERINQVLKP